MSIAKALNRASQRTNLRGDLCWHPTPSEMERAATGDCCCSWCITNCTWEIIVEEMDNVFISFHAREC